MARRFTAASSDVMTFAPGTATGLGAGAFTIAVLHKPATNHRGGILKGLNGGGFSGLNLTTFDTDTMFLATSASTAIGAYGTGAWRLDVFSKASGTVIPRRHSYSYTTGLWTHADAAGTIDNATNTPHTVLRVGNNTGSEYYDGDIAAIAGFLANLSVDATIEASGIHLDLASWMDLSPAFMWRFNQASTATAVTDLTGNGANQVTVTGTSVVADPVGFNYHVPGVDAPPSVQRKVRVAGSWVPVPEITAGTQTALNTKVTKGTLFLSVKDAPYGAVGDGTTDDTVAIRAAFTAANALARAGVAGTIKHPGATVIIPPGTYKLTSIAAVIDVMCNVVSTGATFLVPDAYAGSVLRVGHPTSGSVLQAAEISLPDVVKSTGAAQVASSVGVVVQNLYSSKVRFGRVAYFETGIWFTGLGEGFSYNEVFLGWVGYCKVAVQLKPSTGGWVNQNVFSGGGIQQSTGYAGGIRQTGWRHLVLDGAGINPVNGNTFVGVSFEGDVSEYVHYLHSAYQNGWIGCRYEVGTANRATTVSGATLTTTAHGLAVGDMVIPTASVAPTGMVVLTPYYVIAVPDANTFTIGRNKVGSATTFGSAGTSVVWNRPHRVYVDTSGTGVSDNTIKNMVNPQQWLEIVHSTAIAAGNVIETPSVRISDFNSPEELPPFRARNAYTSSVTRPLFATYAPTSNPMENPGNWAVALSDRGVIWNAGTIIRTGTGTPEGAVTAPVGSVFLRTDGSTGTTMHVKETGSGNTGWVTTGTDVPLSASITTVRAATTANITIATALNNGDVLDGVTLATNDLVLVKNQTAPEENGIYVVGVTPARATAFDTFNEHVGVRLVVTEGTTNVSTVWLITVGQGGVLGTTPISVVKEMWLSASLGIYNVKAYGAKGDGTTDDRVAIQACINAAPAGSTVYFPPGTYMVSINDTTNCLHIPVQRLALVGSDSHDASVIKLMNSQGNYYSIITDQPIGSGASGAGQNINISGFTMRNLTIDQNSANNPISDASVSGPLFTTYPTGGGYPRLAVRCYNGFDGLIEKCHFTNIDSVNTIAMNGGAASIKRWTIRDNLFDNIGPGAAHDHSTLYFHGAEIKVVGNRFIGVGPAAIVAIELHGDDQLVTHNRIWNMYGAMNITGAAASSKNMIVTHNVATGMGAGIQLWSRLYTPMARAATTANITIATALNNGDVLDGVTLATNDRVLVKDQTAPAENGVYVVGVTPARAVDFDTFDEHVGQYVAVTAGTVNSGRTYVTTATAGGTLNTTSIPFVNAGYRPALDKVIVAHNEIEIHYDGWPAGYRSGVLIDTASNSAFRNVKIVDNLIYYRDYVGTPTSADYYSAGICWSRAIAAGGGSGADSTIEISRNTIEKPLAAGIRFDPYASARGVKINNNRIIDPGSAAPAAAQFRTGVSILVRDPAVGVTTPAVAVDNVEVSGNEVIDTRSTHTIASAVDASFSTAPFTNVRAINNTYSCWDGVTSLPVLAIGTVGTWYTSHSMPGYVANTGSNFAAGSSVLDTTTGLVRYQTATPAGSTWTVPTPVTPTPPDIQFFTSSGTWTKPANAITVQVEIIGGGGGGGSGRRGTSGTVIGGGGGGGGSIMTSRTFKASDLSATEAVTIGTGGAGGAAVTANDTNGNVGSLGVVSSFGTRCSSVQGIGGNGATGVAGGTGAVSWLTSTAVTSSSGGAAGGAGAVGVGTSPAIFGAGGGAGGGGISATPAAFAGGASQGSFLSTTAGGGAGGLVDSTAPGSGTAPGPQGSPGPGGGGGAASITTTGQTGATPNGYGGGGGGGGASLNGNNSGAGGAGAPGSCKVTTYF